MTSEIFNMGHPYLTDEQLENWKNLKGTVKSSPNYIDLVQGIWHTITWYYAPNMWKDYVFPQSFIDEFLRFFNFPLNQVYYIIYIAIGITLLRYAFERYVCKVSTTKVTFDITT